MSRAMRWALVLMVAIGLGLPVAASAKTTQCTPLSGKTVKVNKKFKNRMNVKVWVKYFDTAGFTIVDPTGIYWYIKGKGVSKGNQKYPKAYWYDAYALYTVGSTMKYQVNIWNKRCRDYKNLRVIAIQEYLNPDGGDGKDLPGCSTDEWKVKKLSAKRIWRGWGTHEIIGGTASGLDQTHVQIQYWHPKWKWCGKPYVLFDDPQAGIFCPPEE